MNNPFQLAFFTSPNPKRPKSEMRTLNTTPYKSHSLMDMVNLITTLARNYSANCSSSVAADFMRVADHVKQSWRRQSLWIMRSSKLVTHLFSGDPLPQIINTFSNLILSRGAAILQPGLACSKIISAVESAS